MQGGAPVALAVQDLDLVDVGVEGFLHNNREKGGGGPPRRPQGNRSTHIVADCGRQAVEFAGAGRVGGVGSRGRGGLGRGRQGVGKHVTQREEYGGTYEDGVWIASTTGHTS